MLFRSFQIGSLNGCLKLCWRTAFCFINSGPDYIDMHCIYNYIYIYIHIKLFKGYRPCRRPLMRKQSRGMSNAFCLYIFHPHFPKIQMSRGYVNSIIWRDAFCLFMDIWCYFFKVFCIKRFNDARDHGMARKVKRPGHVAFGTHQKKTEKKLPPAKKLRRVGLITAPCPNSGNVQVASNKENLCPT